MIRVKLLNMQLQEVQAAILTPETSAQKTCSIGRAANCDLVLDSVEVSRTHGEIQLGDGQHYYIDRGSANGSFINNKKLTANQVYCLKVGDSISIGEFLLLVESIDSPAKVKPHQVDRLRSSLKSGGSIEHPQRGQNYAEQTVRCVRIINETLDVKTFTFTAESAGFFEYKPGQFVTLELEIDGETVLRSYSISSSPTRPSTLEITVKRVPAPADLPQAAPGLVSNWLHDRLEVGSQVKLGGVLGKFTCFPQPAPKLLMISAGSGITPMMSMSRWIADTATDTNVVFFHASRTPNDIIFRQELELMAARLEDFHLAIAITQPSQSWFGYTGRLNEAMLQLIAPDFCDRTVYVCGPEGFMQSVKTMFERLDFPMQNYFEESFGNSKKVEKAQPKATKAAVSKANTGNLTKPIVRFSQSETEVVGDGTESILELAEQANIKIRSSCRQGVCGACKKRKLEGEVRYELAPEALDADEQASDMILTCIALPVDRVVVEG